MGPPLNARHIVFPFQKYIILRTNGRPSLRRCLKNAPADRHLNLVSNFFGLFLGGFQCSTVAAIVTVALYQCTWKVRKVEIYSMAEFKNLYAFRHGLVDIP
jgi:hypothetical protein